MVEVIMPKMGDGMEEGTLLEWLKKEGDAVKSGESIANIQTDKATLEMEAPGSGTLAGIIVQEGATVPVGKPLAAILTSDEKLPAGWGGEGKEGPRHQGTEAPKESQVTEVTKEEDTGPTSPTPPTEEEPKAEVRGATQEAAAAFPETAANGARAKASPLARKIAEELGVELGSVQGTGPGGRIVEKDVRTAAEGSKGAGEQGSKGAREQGTKVSQVLPTPEDQVVPLNKLRQITAQRTAQSKQTAPHFYVTVEVDCENLLALRSMYERDGIEKPSLNDFVIRACALALRQMPVVNSTFQGDKLLQLGAVNIGMAVALEDGLTLPVLHNADQLSIPQISALAKDLAAKAKANRLSLEELSGATFSISNMGMLNVDVFSAIIVPPNAAILAVGTAKKRAAVDEESGEISVRTRMNLTGSFDHRVVDGAVGAKFMNAVRELLEAPSRLL